MSTMRETRGRKQPAEPAEKQRDGLSRSGVSHDGAQAGARGHVTEIQRARMIAAMIDVVSERTRANATVAHVVARSGVSRRTFYEHFEDREDCFLAAFDDAIEKIAAVVIPAYEH